MHLQSVSRHFNFHSIFLIMWLWVACCMVVGVSSQPQLYLNNFGKNKESRLLSKIHPPLPYGRSNENQINKKLKAYAIDPRMSHTLYGKSYNKKLLTLPVIGDEPGTMDLNNIQQTEGVIGYLDRIKQITPNAAEAMYNPQDSEEKDTDDDDYDNFKIQLSDGRLDDDGRIFFNIDESHNTI